MTDKEAIKLIVELYGRYRYRNCCEPKYEEAIAHIGIRLGMNQSSKLIVKPSVSETLEIRY